MENEREEKFLKLLGSKGTKRILEFLDEHGVARYKQMEEFLNTHTLNQRLRELLAFDLIRHHLERIETRKEWYELTDKGREVLQILQTLTALIKEPS
jgi:DNA-binding HxlR family transcriptional regulator